MLGQAHGPVLMAERGGFCDMEAILRFTDSDVESNCIPAIM